VAALCWANPLLVPGGAWVGAALGADAGAVVETGTLVKTGGTLSADTAV
jgi:hypothetical protein